MTEESKAERLVSELMAGAASDNERMAIAELADARFFESDTFRRRCVRMTPRPARMSWRRVIDMRYGLPEGDPRIVPLDRSWHRAQLGWVPQPETLEELQVTIDLDKPEGPLLAAWRDLYAADPRDPNPYRHHAALCVDELRVRFECWNCGESAAVLIEDDLPVCRICKEEN